MKEDIRKIGIIGNVDNGRAILSSAILETLNKNSGYAIVDLQHDTVLNEDIHKEYDHIILVDGSKTQDETLKINDEVYVKKFTDPRKTPNLFQELKEYEYFKYKRKLDSKINIVDEFKLIKERKSKLSKWEREEVIKEFNKEYYLKIK
jgi:hypothetical protein